MGIFRREKRRGVLIESGMINKRWGSDGGRRVYREMRPLFKSQEWVTVQLENPIERNERQEMEKAEPRMCLEELGFFIPRRRKVRPSTEELGGEERYWTFQIHQRHYRNAEMKR